MVCESKGARLYLHDHARTIARPASHGSGISLGADDVIRVLARAVKHEKGEFPEEKWLFLVKTVKKP